MALLFNCIVKISTYKKFVKTNTPITGLEVAFLLAITHSLSYTIYSSDWDRVLNVKPADMKHLHKHF